MMAFIAGLLGSRLGATVTLALLLATTAAAGLLYWRGESQAGRIETLAVDVATLTSERDNALATAAHIRRQAEQQAAALDARRQQAIARADRMERTITEILNAPDEDDGPLAPVLARIVGVRGPEADSPAAAGGPGRPAGVLARTGADPP